MARCAYKNCVNQAPEGRTHCIYHKEYEKPALAPAPAKPTAIEDDVQVIDVRSIPFARTNEVAIGLLNTLKSLPEGKALKVPLKKVPKQNLLCTERYARSQELRIRVRIVGDHGYLWKMSADEIKAADAKGERMRNIVGRKKGKAAHA
jgi:hypothetical protein